MRDRRGVAESAAPGDGERNVVAIEFYFGGQFRDVGGIKFQFFGDFEMAIAPREFHLGGDLQGGVLASVRACAGFDFVESGIGGGLEFRIFQHDGHRPAGKFCGIGVDNVEGMRRLAVVGIFREKPALDDGAAIGKFDARYGCIDLDQLFSRSDMNRRQERRSAAQRR